MKSSTTLVFEVPTIYCGMLRGLFPKVISYGETPEPECMEVLQDHSTQFRNFPNEKGFLCTKAWRYSSMMRFKTSVCQSVCGWYTKLMRSLVPRDQNNSCQNRLMNRGLQSEKRLLSIPWSFLTMSIKRSATVWEVWWDGSIPNWIPFKKWSTTTRIVVWSWYAGKPIIKSRVIFPWPERNW